MMAKNQVDILEKVLCAKGERRSSMDDREYL
jgi:hypothetical protein